MHNRSVGQREPVVTLHGSAAPAQDPDRHAARVDAESTLSQMLDGPAAVELTSSCTHALEAAATVLGIGPGDQVIVPAFSFPSTANPFVLRGAILRFADCEPDTGNVTAETIRRCGSSNTRAVVCMHYGGVGCDMEPIVELCREAGWTLIEDAAHSLFGRWSGTPLGRFGTFAAFSFHRTKNISCHDGGALVVNDPEYRESVSVALDKGTNRVAFERGDVDAFEWTGPGSSWRLSDALVNALAAQLRRSQEIQAARHRVWDLYAAELATWATASDSRMPLVPEGAEHPAHIFWLTLADSATRDGLVEHCAGLGIEVARHFGSLPASNYGSRLALPQDRCPEAELFAETLVRLPLHPELTESDAERVIEAVASFPVG